VIQLIWIYDLSKYKNSNEGYKYLLAILDVFSRKAYVSSMKSKNSDDVIASLEAIMEESNYKPASITTDTDKLSSATSLRTCSTNMTLFTIP
jgi:hypothetical protein